MTTEDSDRTLAALGLAAMPRPEGEEPDLLELDLLRRGELSGERRDQVLAWVAYSPAVAAEFKSLEQAESWLAEHADTTSEDVRAAPAQKPTGSAVSSWPRRLAEWLGGWQPALGMAVAAGLVAALIVPILFPAGVDERIDQGYSAWDRGAMLDPTLWPWGASRGAKTPAFWEDPAATPGPDQQAFQAGVRIGLASLGAEGPTWAESMTALAEKGPDCPGGDPGSSCRERVEWLRQAGRWAVLLFWQCQAPQRPGVDWAGQSEILEMLANAGARGTTKAPYDEHLKAWLGTGGDPAAALCGGVEEFLALGMRGAP